MTGAVDRVRGGVDDGEDVEMEWLECWEGREGGERDGEHRWTRGNFEDRSLSLLSIV